MEFLQYILSAFYFIVIFSGLIIIHEFGHFFAARWSGVKVLEFGVGMGKKIYGKQIGETEFTLNMIPFGGFVRMLGEEESSDDPNSYEQAALWKRMAITLAGVFLNFVFAIFSLTILFTVGSDPIIISNQEVIEARETGVITYQTEAGVTIPYEEAQARVKDGEKIKTVLQEVKKPLGEAFVFSLTESFRISKAIVDKFSEIPGELINKQKLPDGVSGPVGIAQATHHFAQKGFIYLFRLMALISLSLAVMNMLPIPALDGGRFLFQLVEMVLKPIGVKLNQTIENYVHFAGYMLLMAFLLFVTWNDIMRIFGISFLGDAAVAGA